MNKNTRLGKHPINAAGLLLVVFLVVVGIGMINKYPRKGGTARSQASKIETLPALRSLARGFPITNIVGSRKDGYQVTMRNDYDKGVVAFELGVGYGRMTRDLLELNKSIAPGAYHTEFQGYEEKMDTQPLTLFGVVLEDGSGDGLPDTIKAIKDLRLGAKMQLAQFTPILERALESRRAGSPEGLDALMSQTNALPNDAVEGLPFCVKFGFHNEQQRLLSELRQIKGMQGDGVSIQQETEDHIVRHLLKLKADNEARNTRLTDPVIR